VPDGDTMRTYKNILADNQPPKSTQPGHPYMNRCIKSLHE